MKDTHSKFSMLTVVLHWLIGIVIIIMLIVGSILEDMESGPDKLQLLGVHKSIGVLILVLAIGRIFWRMQNKFPKPLSEMPNWQKRLASLAHWVLIIGTVLMPISGILMTLAGGHSLAVFGIELVAGSGAENESLSKVGHILHGLGSKLMVVFLLLHIAGAVKHQFIDKDGTLARMAGKTIPKA